ncbi:MAG TPA: hypothetical protein VLF68_04420 [Candidatus Saccharimonadales bacterium]|nr:hypothetical protein [Candidatus Saccharimonadales bacterium]
MSRKTGYIIAAIIIIIAIAVAGYFLFYRKGTNQQSVVPSVSPTETMMSPTPAVSQTPTPSITIPVTIIMTTTPTMTPTATPTLSPTPTH